MIQRLSFQSHVLKLVLTSIAAIALILMGATNAFASSGYTSAVANLQHTPTGTAALHVGPHGYVLTVTVSLTGLAPNSTHPAHIHAGNSCAANGAIIYPLNNVVANAAGQASVTTIVRLSSPGIPATGWYINVHNGPTLATPNQAEAIACGVVSNTSGSSDVLTFLGPTPDANQSAYGYTHVSLNNETMTVNIMVTGLAPYSKHAAHIHAGNCYDTMQVLYDLSPLVADGNGVAMKTVTFHDVDISSIPQNAWDVNVHFSTNLTTQTGYDPILCGDVVPQ